MSNDVFTVSFPEKRMGLDQDREFCILRDGSCERKIRFHDYHEIYQVEGLYEHLFYEVLKCNSPATVCGGLMDVIKDTDISPEDLRVLDVGAGNGMVGEELMNLGAEAVIGIDIIPEARDAQLRDRPDIYEDYLVQDLTSLGDGVRKELMAHNLNCMTTVAALGFGDIPPAAFSEGFNLIEEGGVVAFNIRDKFIESNDSSGFSELIGAMEGESILDVRVQERYRHRLDIDGNPLHYYVVAGVKNGDIPQEMIEQFG